MDQSLESVYEITSSLVPSFLQRRRPNLQLATGRIRRGQQAIYATAPPGVITARTTPRLQRHSGRYSRSDRRTSRCGRIPLDPDLAALSDLLVHLGCSCVVGLPGLFRPAAGLLRAVKARTPSETRKLFELFGLANNRMVARSSRCFESITMTLL